MSDQSRNFSEEDLLSYVHGTASEDLVARIDADQESDPSLMAEIALMKGLKPALAQTSEGLTPLGELEWKRLEAQIRRERAETSETRVLASDRGGRIVMWQAAAVFFALVAAGQLAYSTLLSDPAEPTYQTATGASAEHVLVIGFAPGATAAEISAILRSAGGRIIDGPAASGFYRVAFDTADAMEEGRESFIADPSIKTVLDQ